MITVVGSSNTDLSVRVDRFPSVGETVLGREVFVSGGGKGANQAAAIAKLGGDVNFIANIGADYFGRESIKNLEKLGINTKFVKIDHARPSGRAFIFIDGSGRNMIVVGSGSNMFLKPADIIKRAECIKKSRVTLLQLEVPPDTVKAAVSIARRYNSTVILNPAPARRLSRELLSNVDILIPNEVELAMLSGETADGRRFINSILRRSTLLLKRGVGCVIITLGKKGALLVARNKVRLFKAKKARVVDTTCAGDAFCGAVAFCLDKGRSIEEAIEFANYTAALTVCKLGAQSSLPTLTEVNKKIALS